MKSGVDRVLNLKKVVRKAHGIRNLTKKDMKFNGETPELRVDPETYRVYVNGEEIKSEPQKELPLAQRYTLF